MKKIESEATEPSFEDQMHQLEVIIADMESENVSLEALLQKFQEGQALLAACQKKLERAEMMVRVDQQGVSITPCNVITDE